MATVTSNIEQVGHAAMDKLEDRVKSAARRALATTGIHGEGLAKAIFESEAKDTGRALNSITSEVIDVSEVLLKVVVGSNLAYVWFIEHGRKPGRFPNLDALVGWTARKLKDAGIGATVNVSFNELKELARVMPGQKATASQKAARIHLGLIFMVGRKIATKGIREKLIFKRIEEELNTFFGVEYRKELDSAI